MNDINGQITSTVTHSRWLQELILSFPGYKEASCGVLVRESEMRYSHVLPFLPDLPAFACWALTLGTCLPFLYRAAMGFQTSQAGAEPWLLELRHHY